MRRTWRYDFDIHNIANKDGILKNKNRRCVASLRIKFTELSMLTTNGKEVHIERDDVALGVANIKYGVKKGEKKWCVLRPRIIFHADTFHASRNLAGDQACGVNNFCRTWLRRVWIRTCAPVYDAVQCDISPCLVDIDTNDPMKFPTKIDNVGSREIGEPRQ